MGYDISDYRDIDPKYGTLNDVDELIAQLKQRDMKLMMDLVVNHTSNQVSSNVIVRALFGTDVSIACLVSRIPVVN